MALGRKKVTLPDDPAEEPLVEDVVEEVPSDEAVADADLTGGGALDEALSETPEEDTGAAQDERPESADSLLDMFTTVGIQQVDRSLLVGLAGEVDMDDLISELGIVAAALGIVMSERVAAPQPGELAAAA